MLPLCELQQRGYCHCLSVREGILLLCGLQQWGYCHCLSVSGDALTLWVTAEGILSLSGLQQREYCHSVGYSRGYTVTVCLSERGYCHSMGYTVLHKRSLSYNMKYITNRWYWGFWPCVYILASHIYCRLCNFKVKMLVSTQFFQGLSICILGRCSLQQMINYLRIFTFIDGVREPSSTEIHHCGFYARES